MTWPTFFKCFLSVLVVIILHTFVDKGRLHFFNTFFQHAKFITGQHADGLLSDTSEDERERGFVAFLKLIGTLYFKKHISATASLNKC